jgi:hypothetical protein
MAPSCTSCSPSTVAAVLAAALLGGCFSPDYGLGGFQCTNGLCPEGYVCVMEGTFRVCRRPGTRTDVGLDRAGLDRAVVDLRDRGSEESSGDLIGRDAKLDAMRPDTLVGHDVRIDGCAPQPFFKDGDGDGYGDPLLKVVLCAPPAGYVPKSLDCDDGDADAHPGQAAFFDQPSQGSKSFDYNCDKLAEKEHPSLVSCSPSGAGCTGDGWVGGVPACGQTGSYATCFKQSGMSGCSQSLGALVQRCR